MSIHREHPIQGDPADAILYDNCDRCTEHAKQLTSLDTRNAERLVDRVMEVERFDGRYRSLAEAEAGRRVLHAADLIARGTGRRNWTEVLA